MDDDTDGKVIDLMAAIRESLAGKTDAIRGEATPGPWFVGPSNNERGRYADSGQIWVAHGEVSHRVIASVNLYSPEADATARLIAAAPDLLNALSDLGQVVDDGMCYDRCATMPHLHRAGHSNVCQAARAAIEKAHA